jgi:biopolymer transport protein ExbD
MPRKPREPDEVPEINLTPIMSILVILIPVLLFAFNFFQLRITEVQASRSGQAQKKPGDDKKPLNLAVNIRDGKGFQITQTAEVEECGQATVMVGMLGEDVVARAPKDTIKDGDRYDYAGLYNALMKKKQRCPKEVTVNVGADFTVPWHIVARTVDATRVQLSKDGKSVLTGASWEDYVGATILMEDDPDAKPGEDGKRPQRERPLFPAVVFMVTQ